MKRIRIRWLIIGLILVGIFNLSFFLIDFNRDLASIWISYAFIHLAYMQLFAVPFLIPKSKSAHVFVESTSAIAAIYFLIELVLGSVFVILALEEWKMVLLIQLSIFVACMLILYINFPANKRTANTEHYKKQVQKTIKTAANYLQQAKQFAKKEDSALIEDTYSELKASPLLVDESVRGLENNILTGCKTILDAAQTKQYDEMRKQIAWVSQLIYLRKNSEI